MNNELFFFTSPALSYSHDFTYIFKNMKKSYEAIDLGKLFVSEYYHSYGATAVDSLAKSINALEEDTKKYLFTEYLQQDYQVYDNCKGKT